MFLCIILFLSIIIRNESARILAVFPTPLARHQSVHRAIVHELIHRGHEVVAITPLPEYPRGSSPENLMEIDVSNVTAEVWKEHTQDISLINKNSEKGLQHFLRTAAKVVEKQFLTPEVTSFIRNNETFDLLLLETWIRPTLFWSFFYDAPVVSISSHGPFFNDYSILDSTHSLSYPTRNSNIWQKIVSLYDYWKMNSMYNSLEKEENEMAKRLFGDVPSLKEQMKKIQLFLVNTNPIWQGIRPVPMNVLHIGGPQLQENKTEITEEIKHYLNSSTNGVVYASLDTKTQQWVVPKQTLNKFIKAFSKLPCSVLWECDDDVSGLPYNVKAGKWFPQAEILKHPNVRLFINDCSQQSTDEALAAAVPILGLPMTADQRSNAALLSHHNVGTSLDLEEIGDEEFRNIIEHTMRNESYRTNMHRLRKLLLDTAAPAPIRAVDAIEYVLSHSCGHLVSPAHNVHWFQYLEIELIIIVITYLLISMFVLYKALFHVFKLIVKRLRQKRKKVMLDGFKNML